MSPQAFLFRLRKAYAFSTELQPPVEIFIFAKSIGAGRRGHSENLLSTGESPQIVLAVSRNRR